MTSAFEFCQNDRLWSPTFLSPPSNAIHSGVLETSTPQESPSPRYFHLTRSHLYQGQTQESTSYCDFKADLRWVTLKPFEERTNGSLRFGFSLFSKSFQQDFYVKSQEDLNQWLDCLEQICILRDITEDFTLIRQIGSGGQSDVYLSISLTTGKEVAMKHFDKRRFINHPKGLAALANEIDILRRISHPRVMKLYRVYEDDQAVYLVTELIPGRTLLRSLNIEGTFLPSEAKQFVQNMLDLFTYFTAEGILHRDVKPENIMIPDSATRGDFKLIDFGFATNWTGTDIKESCGSPGYMAPELMSEHSHGQSVDIYSAGMVFYVLIAGYSPFYATSRSEVLRLNAENSITFGDKWKVVDIAYIELIESMTATDPRQRKSVALLKAAFLVRLTPAEAVPTGTPANMQDDYETQS